MDAQPQDPRSSLKESVRIGVVLSAGGLRGAAHAGVLRQLVRHGVPLHTIVGVSAGAIVAAYYAAVGLELDEMIADAGAVSFPIGCGSSTTRTSIDFITAWSAWASSATTCQRDARGTSGRDSIRA